MKFSHCIDFLHINCFSYFENICSLSFFMKSLAWHHMISKSCQYWKVLCMGDVKVSNWQLQIFTLHFNDFEKKKWAQIHHSWWPPAIKMKISKIEGCKGFRLLCAALALIGLYEKFMLLLIRRWNPPNSANNFWRFFKDWRGE